MFVPGPSQRAALEHWFHDNFTKRGELGASVSIWHHGQEWLHLNAGFAEREQSRAWTADTLVPVWSATKGPAAVACLMALHEASLPLEAPVVEAWPAFGQQGKERITFAELLSHRAGLCALSQRVPITDFNAVTAALEQQEPLWPRARVQAYHARTFGFLLDVIVRRLTGADSLGHYFDTKFGRPLDLDFWIGLPQEQYHRVARLYPGKLRSNNSDSAFLKAFSTPGSVTQQTFASPTGLNAVQDFNRPDTWAGGYASMGGVGSARALAKFYSALASSGQWHGQQLIPSSIVKALSQPLSQANDAVLCVPMAFSAGMMMDPVDAASGQKLRQKFGPHAQAFGHPGAGGSLAFADPQTGISFAYVMNQMEVGVLPSDKALGLVAALFSERR